MRLKRRALMDKLGVGRDLHPYEIMPWAHSDEEEGIDCSAEVRVEGDGDQVEAELQFMYEDPPEGKAPLEQVAFLRAILKQDEEFDVSVFRVRGEDKEDAVYNWQEKGCNFFKACVREIKAGRLPDIDMILEREFRDERGADKVGEGSSKAPRINTGALLNDMKQGKGF